MSEPNVESPPTNLRKGRRPGVRVKTPQDHIASAPTRHARCVHGSWTRARHNGTGIRVLDRWVVVDPVSPSGLGFRGMSGSRSVAEVVLIPTLEGVTMFDDREQAQALCDSMGSGRFQVVAVGDVPRLVVDEAAKRLRPA